MARDDKTAPPAPSLEDLLQGNLAEDADDAAEEEILDAPWSKTDEELMREAMERELETPRIQRSGPLQRGDKVTGTVVHLGRSDIAQFQKVREEPPVTGTKTDAQPGKIGALGQ